MGPLDIESLAGDSRGADDRWPRRPGTYNLTVYNPSEPDQADGRRCRPTPSDLLQEQLSEQGRSLGWWGPDTRSTRNIGHWAFLEEP